MKPSSLALSIWPASASASAAETDHLIWLFTLLTLVLVIPIFIGITFFAFRYRDGKKVNRKYREDRDRTLEIGWMLIPFVLTLIFFAWGAKMFIVHKNPPPNAMRIEAIGRQWMWKFQHPGGQAEINDLHVPTGEPILIHMISQDVIHSLYIPALRIQMETLPGRYTEFWFNADRPGTYRILCSEFCGTDHSVMGGLLTIMTPADYADWLTKAGSSISLEASGQRSFARLGCAGCHEGSNTARAPTLGGLAGTQVPLEKGGTVLADDAFLRDKILNPDSNKIVGYKQVMPTYKGIIKEDEMNQLVAFIRGGATLPSPSKEASR
jgi:cytochrome c oxidase subunit 2